MAKKKHVFDRMIANYSLRWFPAIGEKVFPALVYSGFCQSFQKYEEAMDSMRFRLHMLLLWKHGLYKSTIIAETVRLFGVKSNIVTTSSAAAMRGSFTEKTFVPPEFLVSDIMLLTELSSVLGGDKEIIGQLMTAMEESDMRIALVKIGQVKPKVLAEVRSYGADIEDCRLIYRNKATIISASHSIDQIPEANRQAYLSRQYIVQISPSEVPYGLGWKEQSDHRDEKLYVEFAKWFQKQYKASQKPDLAFGKKAIKIMRKSFSSTFDPDSRQMNDIRKMIYARHGLFPKETVNQVVIQILPFIVNQEGKTTRDKLVELILSHPATVDDITKYLNISSGAFYSYRKRLGIKSVSHSNPTKYYLDKVPPMVNWGGKRQKGKKVQQNVKKPTVRVAKATKPTPPKKAVVKKPAGRPKKKKRGFAIKPYVKKAGV